MSGKKNSKKKKKAEAAISKISQHTTGKMTNLKVSSLIRLVNIVNPD